MKTLKRELAHVGMFGPDGVRITERMLADCADTFDGKCPVTLGHRLADWMPKFGNVSSVELSEDGKSLRGPVEVNDLLADAVDARFYEDHSIGIQKRAADGKYYLHHLAFLGAVPPKIRDLKVFADLGVVYCGDDGAVDMFADGTSAAATDGIAAALQRIADKGRAAWPFKDAMKALEDLVSWATEMLLSGAEMPAALKEQITDFADQLAKGPGAPGKEEDVETKEELAATKAELETARTELADSKAEVLSIAKEGIRKAMEGRVPKAKQNLVLELADRLADSAPLELADEGGTKETVSSLEILRRVLEAVPKPVSEGRAELGDQDTDKPIDLGLIKNRY